MTVMVAANIGCAEEKLFYEDADGWFDITGIYVLNYPENSGYPIRSSYVVISGNKDEYIATAVSKDLYFLHALSLIKEFLESQTVPPLEEFAVSFTTTREDIIAPKKFYVTPVVPFPERITTMEETEAARWISVAHPFNYDKGDFEKEKLQACVSTDTGIMFHPTLCYKKIF